MELTKLGAVTLDEETNAPTVQADVEIEGEDVEPYGQLDFFGALGVTALPAPEDDSGAAEAVVAPVGGTDGSVIASRDLRATGLYGQLKPGETALHSTGKGFGSQVLCKDKKVAAMAGPGSAMFLDGGAKRYAVQVGTSQILLESDGATISAGGCKIIMQGGTIYLVGKVILGGVASMAPVAYGPGGSSLNLQSAFVTLSG